MPTLQELCLRQLEPMVHEKDRSNLATADAKRVRLETKYYDEQYQAHSHARMNPKRLLFWDGNENGSFVQDIYQTHNLRFNRRATEIVIRVRCLLNRE
jgi:hypothetical protein